MQKDLLHEPIRDVSDILKYSEKVLADNPDFRARFTMLVLSAANANGDLPMGPETRDWLREMTRIPLGPIVELPSDIAA